jgi:serine/threonine protein kinase
LKTLEHQHLVSMIESFNDVESSEGEINRYIVLEYCSKGDLAKFLLRNYRKKPMPQDVCISM